MKKLTLITAILLIANLLFAQYNKIDTSFYSEALQETKMVDIYFPPGYDENPDLFYPVIYYLHGWNGNQNTMGEMLSTVQSLINNGTIEPVIMVGADNSPVPFEGSMYVNSELWGDYEDYMINDLINWVDLSFRTIPEKNARALLGQSMGAYGSFRYGIVHKDKFKAFAAHAGIVTFNKDLWMDSCRQKVIQENQPGPPYAYNYSTDGLFTRGTFLVSGAFSPNANTPQTYINPPVVEFLFDENADYIDSILVKWQPFDLTQQIKQLSPEDSVGIYFGCGTNDDFLLYPANQALNDTLNVLGIPHHFYSHTGNHNMPAGFKQGALIFIDSLLMPPLELPTSCLPEGIFFYTQEEIDNFQINYPYCNEIEGDVIFSGSDIANLNGLNVLTYIGGYLSIESTLLTSLQGLENLNLIGGDLRIGVNFVGWSQPNTLLSDISSLENLTFIGQSLMICSNPALTSLTGLENLTNVGISISLSENNVLSDIGALSSLVSIGGNIAIYNNEVLSSLSGLQNIDGNTIESLNITNNSSLSTCHVESICEYLVDPYGFVEIWNNSAGCSSQEEIDSLCNITNVPNFYNESDLAFSPNPVNNWVTLSLRINSKISVEICIYNITGICLKSWQFQYQQPGQKEFTLDLKGLPAGIYFCRVQIGNEIISRKIIKQ